MSGTCVQLFAIHHYLSRKIAKCIKLKICVFTLRSVLDNVNDCELILIIVELLCFVLMESIRAKLFIYIFHLIFCVCNILSLQNQITIVIVLPFKFRAHQMYRLTFFNFFSCLIRVDLEIFQKEKNK